MKPIITAILILGSVHSLNAQKDYDPFTEPGIQKNDTVANGVKEHPKIKPTHIATTGGTIDWDDIRIVELMKAVTAYYQNNMRVPNSKEELVSFASSRGYSIGSPNTLTHVEFVDGMFSYSVRYPDGRICLSHIPLSKTDKAEQGGADQPATAPQSKPSDKSTPNPESKPRPQ